MRKILLQSSAIGLLLLLTSANVLAGDEVLFRVNSVNLLANDFVAIAGSGANATENVMQYVCESPGTFKNLKFNVLNAPGAGKSRTLTFRLAGNTSLACTISGTQTYCEDKINSVAAVNPNLVAYQHTTSGAPANTPGATAIIFSSQFSSDSLFSNGVLNASINRFLALKSTNQQTQSSAADTIIPSPGNILRLYVTVSVAPGAGKSLAFTVQKNDADGSPSVTCTISGGGTFCSDQINVLAMVAADLISIKAAPSGTPTVGQAMASVSFAPTTPNYFTILAQANSASNSRFTGLEGTGLAANSTEAQTQSPSQTMLFRDLRVLVGTSPGAGKSMTITLRKGAANTSLTCTISGLQTTCNDPNGVDRYISNQTPSELLNTGFTSVGGGSPATKVSYVGIVPRRIYLVD